MRLTSLITSEYRLEYYLYSSGMAFMKKKKRKKYDENFIKNEQMIDAKKGSSVANIISNNLSYRILIWGCSLIYYLASGLM